MPRDPFIFLGGCLNHIDGLNAGVVNTFSTQTSMTAAPINRDRTASTQGSGTPILSPERRSRRVGSGVEDRFASRPSPRLRLGTFNGRRPTRESLIGNGGGAPPVSVSSTARTIGEQKAKVKSISKLVVASFR